MKIVTILGTRPEIIRLSRIIPKLDNLCNHYLVNTAQNYDANLNDLFFRELGIRNCDECLNCKGSTSAELIASILVSCERVLLREKPDRLLILGDTYSALCAIVAKKMGIAVYHMEAGNRCYDDRVPEEINRRIIDHSSDVLLPYTERSRMNLVREGFANQTILVTGNPIFEVLKHYESNILSSKSLQALSLSAQKFFLVTMHRAENVDNENRLRNILGALNSLATQFNIPVVCSLHPRTRSKLEAFKVSIDSTLVRMIDPPGLFDFVNLEKNAFCVLSDSGTVQEECCLFGIPNVTIRDVTERPETLESGSNMLSGSEPDAIARCVKTVTGAHGAWTPPTEYTVPNVSDTVVKVVLGYRHDAK